MYPYKIGGVFTLYGLMIGIGIACCYVVLWTYCKKAKTESRFVDFMTYASLAAIVVGFFFAMLFQAVYAYIENPEEGFNLLSGMTFIGGLIGGVLSFFIIYMFFRKKYQSKFLDISSVLPCSITLAHGFGRIGCFFAGCCYGMETDSVFGVTFVGMHTPVYPTQLFEAAFLFVLFGVMSFLFLKYKFKYNFPLYLVAYGVFRFLIEFIRDDDRGSFIPGISPSQFWSILMFIIGIALFFAMKFWLCPKREAYLKEHPIVEPEKPKKVKKLG